MPELGNLNVMGETDIAGGNYNKVSVLGTLNATDKIDAHTVSVTGTFKSSSDMTCDNVKIMGDMSLVRLTVRESANILGQLKAESISAERFDVLGFVKCGSFECTSLEVNGALEVEGLLNAETLSIKSRNHSTAGEVGGKHIRVRHPFPAGFKTLLTAEIIEYDDVDIEYVRAQTVRGKNLIIGRGCHIGTAEYSGTLERHPDAEIGSVVKL